MATLVSEQQYDFWARELGSIAAWRRVFARVESVRPEAGDTVSIVLRVNRNFSPAAAGQHVTLSVDIDGRRTSRSYSLSRPLDKGRVCLTVRREPGGVVSNYLHDRLQPGDMVELSQPFGELGTGLVGGDRPLLMLASGSGITAVYNFLAKRADAGQVLNGALLYWEKHPDRFCFDAELAQLQAAHPGLQLRRFCNAAEPVDGLRRGRFDAAMAGALRNEFPAAAVLACGGSAFVDAVRQELATAPGGFSAEAFTPPSSPHVVDGEETFFDLVLQRSNRRLRVSSRQPLLVALEEAGMSPPHGCRMGICNSCSCQQRRGETVNDVNGARLQGGGAVRLCVSRASSDLELEL